MGLILVALLLGADPTTQPVRYVVLEEESWLTLNPDKWEDPMGGSFVLEIQPEDPGKGLWGGTFRDLLLSTKLDTLTGWGEFSRHAPYMFQGELQPGYQFLRLKLAYADNPDHLIADIPSNFGAALARLGRTAMIRGGASSDVGPQLFLTAVPIAEDANLFFVRGDVTGDGVRNLTDAIMLLHQVFDGHEISCLDAADADDNGTLELQDAALLLRHLFAGGEALPPPSLWCGLDLPGDDLDCKGQEYCKRRSP